MTRRYNLAQVNIAKARASLDEPIMRGFVDQLASINALADSTPGFVWRLASDVGDNTYLRPYADPLVIFNLSIWQSVDALKRYVYRTSHGAAIRDRKQWFDPIDQAHFALWWIPAGHIPSVEEAKQRLSHRQAHGDGPMAFSFTRSYEMPLQPDDDRDAQPTIDCDGRVLALSRRSALGDCGALTRFRYGQERSRVWATYDGDGIRFGTLVAVCDHNGRLHGCYQHLDSSDRLRVGRYVGRAHLTSDARLRISENWVSDRGHGHSVVEELREGDAVTGAEG